MTAITKQITIPLNHRLHLDIEVPAEMPVGEAVIRLIFEAPRMQDNAKAMEALTALADRGGCRSIDNPEQWQRDMRADRSLPGRGDA